MHSSGRIEPYDYRMSGHKHTYGLRTVATIEAVKGVVVLILGIAVLMLVHKDLDAIAERVTDALHVSPDGKISNFVFAAADKATSRGLWFVFLGALVYSTVRFVEAYGLWHERDWAEWFALLSGCLYLPWEIYRLFRRPDLLNWGVLFINVLVLLYMVRLRMESLWQRNYDDG